MYAVRTLSARSSAGHRVALLSGVHSVMRVKLALAGEGGGKEVTSFIHGWGVHAHPLLLHLPSPVKLQCTLQLSGQTH